MEVISEQMGDHFSVEDFVFAVVFFVSYVTFVYFVTVENGLERVGDRQEDVLHIGEGVGELQESCEGGPQAGGLDEAQ